VEWILARPLYRFRSVDLRQIPRARRQQALKLELDHWSPYVTSGYYIAWQNDFALVWCWDDARLKQVLAASRLNPKRIRVIPESLLYPAYNSGLRVIKCLEGFEGQVWENGQLKHSRWWPQQPSSGEWLAFQRDAGVQPEQQIHQVPEPLVLAAQRRPWLDSSGILGRQELGWRSEQAAVALGVVLLALPTLWYGLGLVKLQQAQALREAQLSELERQVYPLREARRLALDELARIRELRALDAYPDQLFLMAKVAEVLPKNDSSLKEWNYQQGKLKITVTSPQPLSSSFLVNVFQMAGPFQNVKALAGNDPRTLTLQMDVAGS
jgi:hypothetical protein